MKQLRALLTPKRRARIYEISIAGCAVAVGYGVLSTEHAALWAGLLVPVLGIARDNVPS